MYIFYKESVLAVNNSSELIPTHPFRYAFIDECLDALVKNQGNLSIEVDPIEFIRYCKRTFKFVSAAGGIVQTPDKLTLIIRRNGRWDLPKGMAEYGETPDKTAIREVVEETGIPTPKLGDLFEQTMHIYNTYGDWTLKTTYWYKMMVSEPSSTTPQLAEDITETRWCAPIERHTLLGESYSMMRYLDKKLN